MTDRPLFGIQLHPDHTTWDALREAGLLVDRLGYDLLMTWDHFVPLRGDGTGPNFEGWQLLPTWGALTQRARIGMLVTGNTYRHPAKGPECRECKRTYMRGYMREVRAEAAGRRRRRRSA